VLESAIVRRITGQTQGWLEGEERCALVALTWSALEGTSGRGIRLAFVDRNISYTESRIRALSPAPGEQMPTSCSIRKKHTG